jgi:hypothetical protein
VIAAKEAGVVSLQDATKRVPTERSGRAKFHLGLVDATGATKQPLNNILR